MQVQQRLRVEEYDADDAEAVEAGRVILNAHRAVATPWMPELTPFRRTMEVRHSWDSSPQRHYLARADGVPVAVAEVELGEWDNTDLVWIHLVAHPAHRRHGHGSAFLGQLIEIVHALGRSKVGGSGWDLPGTEAFALRHGFTLRQREVVRVVRPQELAPGLVASAYAEAAPHASDYEILHLEGQAPESMLPLLSDLTAAINDAPLDDLDLEDEAYPVDRIRAYERVTIESGHRLYRVLAVHRESGEPAGHTVVAVDAERPELAQQHDTSVVRAHRGHRLGLLLKADMMRWLAEVEPQITSIDTGNAESNDHMIAINERLGYRVMGSELAFQRD
jgi:GNAT superfamily N-acetyltransferase